MVLVVFSLGALIGIGVFIYGISDDEAGAGCAGFVLGVVSVFLVYLSVTNLFFTGWPLGPHGWPFGSGHPGPPAAQGTHTTCGLNYVYDSLVDMGTSWSVLYSGTAQNNGSSASTATFHASVSTTVSVTDNLGVTLEGGATMLAVITASVKAHINESVTQSITLQVGVDEQYIVPPHSTANAIYGVKVQVVGGHLYTSKDSCNQISWGQVITYVPLSSGWCIWLNSETPCPTVTPPPGIVPSPTVSTVP